MDNVVSWLHVGSWIGLLVVSVISITSVIISFRVNRRLVRLLHGQSKNDGCYKFEKFFTPSNWPSVMVALERLPPGTVNLLSRVLTDKYCSLDKYRESCQALHSGVAKLWAKLRVSWLAFIPVVMTSLVLSVLIVINLPHPCPVVIWLAELVMILALSANTFLFGDLLIFLQQHKANNF